MKCNYCDQTAKIYAIDRTSKYVVGLCYECASNIPARYYIHYKDAKDAMELKVLKEML